MSEEQRPKSLEVTRPIPAEQVESARILMNEGLLEEAKKLLFRLLANHPKNKAALELLKSIESIELKNLFQEKTQTISRPEPRSSTEALIEQLSRDLDLDLEAEADTENRVQWKWSVSSDPQKSSAVETLSSRELYDLAVAFYEMQCFHYAIDVLRQAEKKIRSRQAELGVEGVGVAALLAESLICVGEAFEAKIYLEPILVEPEISHEQKVPLLYLMGLAEEEMGQKKRASGWFKKVLESDPDFREVQFKVQQNEA